MSVEEIRTTQCRSEYEIHFLIALSEGCSAQNHTTCKIINKQKTLCSREETEGFSCVIRADIEIGVQVPKG